MNEERLNYYREWIEENEEIVVDSSIFKELVDEINRLNNIINELEKFLDERSEFTNFGFVLDYLKELKEKYEKVN